MFICVEAEQQAYLIPENHSPAVGELLKTQTKGIQKLAVSRQQPTHPDIMATHTVKPLETRAMITDNVENYSVCCLFVNIF